jgi:aminoglycoside 2'-N-acetyltransferase I
MSIEIDVVNGDAGWAAAEALFDVVWPPHVLEKLPWGNVEFAHADLRVLLRTESGDLACHVGIFRRTVTWNGRTMNAGGIGGVATRDEYTRRGYASMALEAALRTMQDEGSIDFAMLFCEPRLAPFYTERGWKKFDGEIYAVQGGDRMRFTAIGPYVHDVRWRAPSNGVIDLNGLPW